MRVINSKIVQSIVQLSERPLSFILEFETMMEGQMEATDSEGDMKETFRICDEDNDGYISAPELMYILDKLGEKLNNEEIEQLIFAADNDKDGNINLEGD